MGAGPVPSTSNTFAQRGYSVLTFGTEGQNTNFGSASAYIALSVSSHVEGTTVITAQGSGIPAVRTDVITGKQYRITVEDDTNIVPPPRGSIASFSDAFPNTTYANLAPIGNAQMSVAKFIIDDSSFEVERGAIATRVVLATGYPLISVANGGVFPNIQLNG
jgi:hypothetical protein